MSKLFEDEDRREHESYGMVQMSRISGQFTGLFGTNVEGTGGKLPSSRSVNMPDDKFPVGKFRPWT